MKRNILSALVVILYIQTTTASTSSGNDIEFGYSASNGPDTDAWPPLCHNGTRQSPINIDFFSTVPSNLSPLQFHNYDFKGPISVINNGHSVTAAGFEKWGGDGTRQPYITGGGLNGRYNLIGFHFHWGTHDNSGSEHTLEGLHFPLEAHFVHQKANTTDAQAHSEGDGLAVVAVWYRLDNFHGEPLRQLEKAYKGTDAYGQTFNISSVLLDDMIPPNRSKFLRYDGSLTTPNCDEVVIWTILEEPLTVSDVQLLQLRQHSTTMGNLLHNFRNVQPLHHRKVLRT